MANGDFGDDFVWGDGGKPPPFIASALHEESNFNTGLCRGKCKIKHACCGSNVKKRREDCLDECSVRARQYEAQADAAIGNGSGGSGNGGVDWNEELETDLEEAEAELRLLTLQLAQGGGDGTNGSNGKMGNTLIIGGVIVAIIVVIILVMKK